MANTIKALIAALMLSACATAEETKPRDISVNAPSIGADGLKNRSAD